MRALTVILVAGFMIGCTLHWVASRPHFQPQPTTIGGTP